MELGQVECNCPNDIFAGTGVLPSSAGSFSETVSPLVIVLGNGLELVPVEWDGSYDIFAWLPISLVL